MDQKEQRFLSQLAARFGNEFPPSEKARLTLPTWRSIYWLYASFIPLALYALEAVKINFYHVARSPNVDVIPQLFIMMAVYGLWILAPRFCWALIHRLYSKDRAEPALILLWLAGLGVVMAAFHLLAFTFAKLTLFATHAWLWEPIHFLHNYGEVWLDFGGLWLIVYIVTAVFILLAMPFRHKSPAALSRYEVKDNGKTFSIPLHDIFWIKAAGNYVEMHTVHGITMVRKTLSTIEKEISNSGFLKSHRSALINARHVIAIKPRADSSGFVVLLSNDEEAPLSRRRLSDFKALLRSSD